MTLSVASFASMDKLGEALSERIGNNLIEALCEKGTARMLLSGGTTPWPVYTLLSRLELPWKSIELGLVDERFVPNSSDHSNERNIRESLLQMNGARATFFPMVLDAEDSSNNLAQIRESYHGFSEHTDVVILGMGTDGHTASLFPGDTASEAIMNGSESSVFMTTAPSDPTERITCSSALLLKASHMYLIIKGNEKWDILASASENLPIKRFLTARNDIQIYYASS